MHLLHLSVQGHGKSSEGDCTPLGSDHSNKSNGDLWDTVLRWGALEQSLKQNKGGYVASISKETETRSFLLGQQRDARGNLRNQSRPSTRSVQLPTRRRVRGWLVSKGHTLHLLAQSPPVVGLKLGILDSLLTPVLVQSTDMILRLLEELKLVADAFFDKDSTGMLLDNGLLVLKRMLALIDGKRPKLDQSNLP
jgi:hypothetical protein